MTAAEFLIACKARGLSVAEIDELNLGLIVDYIYSYDDTYGLSNKEKNDVKIATQADFDTFDQRNEKAI